MKLRDLLIVSAAVVPAVGCGSPPDNGNAEKVGWTSQPVTVCAGGSTVEGVDVSEFQGSINWTSVHNSGRGFAIARVSDGTGHLDPTFAANWSGIKAAGMVRGVYQFFRASEDPVAQADLLVSHVGTLEPGDLPPVADVEVMDGVSGATLVANLAKWVSEIEAKTGRTPMIYTAPGFWNPLPSTGQFGGEVLWVANWQVSCPDTPTPWKGWSFWQYDDGHTTANVPGISGAVDKDRFDGTLGQLQGFGGPAPWAAQYVDQSFPLATTALTMKEGETVSGYIELKNVGSKTWDSSTHLGTTQPRDRTSDFADASWLGPDRPAGVTGTVAPGGTFKFQFTLHAPNKTGTFYEYFGVVQEGVAWFSDSGQGGPPDDQLEVQIKVDPAPPGGSGDAGAPAGDGGTVGHGSPDGGAGHGGGDAGEGSSSGGSSGGSGSGSGTAGSTLDAGDPLGDDGGDNGSWNADSPSGSSGCSMAPSPGERSPWALGVGLALAVVSFRRRTR